MSIARRQTRPELPTLETLREFFILDAETGTLVWRKSRGTAAAGSRAGCVCVKERRAAVRFNNYLWPVARIIWCMHTGAWPVGEVDHINGDSLDNRPSNLRDVPPFVNKQNHHVAYANSRVGLMGVHERNGRFIGKITRHGKTTYVGTFDTPEEAHAAYVNAKRLIHEGCAI